MTTASTFHRRRLLAWTWQHEHALDGSVAHDELLRRPTGGQSTVRDGDVPETDAAPRLNRRKPRCRSAEDLSSSVQLDNECNSVGHGTRTLGLPSPLGRVRGGGILDRTPRHMPAPVRDDDRDDDKDAESHHDPSISETAADPSLSSLSDTRQAADQRHSGSGSARNLMRWVRVIGIGSSRSTLPATSTSPQPTGLAAASAGPKFVKALPSTRPSSSSFRFSPPRLLDEDRCLSPTQPRYLHVEDSAALSLSYFVLRRAHHGAIRLLHQLGWWGVVLAALTVLEGPVVATTLLFALPFIAATLYVFQGAARQGRHASVQSP